MPHPWNPCRIKLDSISLLFKCEWSSSSKFLGCDDDDKKQTTPPFAQYAVKKHSPCKTAKTAYKVQIKQLKPTFNLP